MTEAETGVFTWRTVADQMEIPPDVLSGMTVPEEKMIFDEIRNRMLYQIRSHVLSFTLPGNVARDSRTVVFYVPETPWQHWKHVHRHAWWMRWLVERRPVRMRRLAETVRFEAVWDEYAVYPWQKAVPVGPGLGGGQRHVQLLVSTNVTHRTDQE